MSYHHFYVSYDPDNMPGDFFDKIEKELLRELRCFGEPIQDGDKKKIYVFRENDQGVENVFLNVSSNAGLAAKIDGNTIVLRAEESIASAVDL